MRRREILTWEDLKENAPIFDDIDIALADMW